MNTSPEIALMAALSAKDRALGKGGALLWHIKEDFLRFKRLTMGHPIIMGRKTYESIGKPLPGRNNIVVTRDPSWRREGVEVAHSLEAALAIARARDTERIFVIGGGELFAEALPKATVLHLTLIEDSAEADTFFPPYEHLFTKKTFEERHVTETGLAYRWVDLIRPL